MTLQISFIAIVKNEAENLSRCLASVKPYVDELIIVDTGSTDDTIAIAQQYNAKVSHFKWCDDFAAARNFAIAQAKGQWILTLDADEELQVQSNEWFSTLMDSPSILACMFPVRDVEDNIFINAIRLFRNNLGIQYVGRYHESPYYQSQLLCIGHLQVSELKDIEIIHYGYTNDSFAKKALTRISLLESIRAQEKLGLPLLLTLAGLYKTIQSFEQYEFCCHEAFERLSPCLLTGDPPEDIRTVRSWLFCLGIELLKNEDQETVRIICQRGLEWFSDYPPFNYLSGFFLKTMGFPRGSIPYFEKCLEAGHTGQYFKGEPFNQALITNDAAYELGCIYYEIGQPQQAIAAFNLALSFDPNYTPAKEQLIIAHQRLQTKQ
jgi:glycosyltransferase involved in cell wall biosynthesis